MKFIKKFEYQIKIYNNCWRPTSKNVESRAILNTFIFKEFLYIILERMIRDVTIVFFFKGKSINYCIMIVVYAHKYNNLLKSDITKSRIFKVFCSRFYGKK